SYSMGVTTDTAGHEFGSVSVWEGEAPAEPGFSARQEPRPPKPRQHHRFGCLASGHRLRYYAQMIAFDCPRCHKPLIVSNRQAGTLYPCPGCKEDILVPQPRPPAPWQPFVKPLLVLLALVAGVAAVGWKVYQD